MSNFLPFYAKLKKMIENIDTGGGGEGGGSGKRVARFTIGTSTAGWTADDVDYLCDGTADQVEIIEALGDLPATGGEIVILDGTYNITASIHIPYDNITIRGNGNSTVLKRGYNSAGTDSGVAARGLITLSGKNYCKIKDLRIDGNKRIHSNSNDNYSINLMNSSSNTITGNTCSNNSSYSINLYMASDNTITGNTCTGNGSIGIRLYMASDNTITGNTCNGNGNGYGIHSSNSSNNTITGNTCNDNNYGIAMSSSVNSTVTGNTCTGNSSIGIRLTGSSNNYNCIVGNNLKGNSTAGYESDGGKGNIEANNVK